MSKVFSFHGGIHPPENKHQSTQSPIAQAPLAKTLHVPLQQHIGVAAKPCVNIGDKVLKGQRIADAQGKFSVPVHAPSSGTITAIENHSVPHPSGMQGICISIDTDGEDLWIEHSGLSDYRELGKDKLIDYIRDRGIAGMGGAGFPTAVKLHLGDDHIVNTLIINAAECEPYITADDLLMRERAEQILKGIDVLQFLLEPSHIIIGIEDNKPQAIRALEIAVQQCNYNIDVVSVPTKYPSGGEKQLIQLLTNIEVPHGGIPADVGIVCQNIGTVYAIHRAVEHGESLISRIITVTGDGVKKPQNYDTLIGTPFADLLSAAGHIEEKTNRLIVGGPMMGYSISDDQIPVVKTSNCIIASTRDEMPEPPPSQACIRCGMCEQVCPVQLLPQQLHWFAKGQEYQKAEQHNLFDCIECGACSYVCPSNIPLVQYYRHAKTTIREEQQEKRKSDLARERFEAKQMREQRAIEEKAAKRKARAEQAAKAQADKKQASDKPAQDSKGKAQLLQTKLTKAQESVKKIEQEIAEHNATEQSEAIALLDIKLQKAKAAVEQAKQALEKSQAPQPETVDIKKLKREAAIATTKLNKAKQALKTAQEKDQPGIEQLAATIETLSKEADIANQAFEKAQLSQPVDNAQAKANTSSAKASDADIKKLKTAAAITRTKLKKAQGKLETAKAEDSDEVSALSDEVKQLETKLEKAQKDFESASANAESGVQSGATSANSNASSADIKKLKTAAAITRTKLKKAQSKLETAQAEGSDETQTLLSEVNQLEEKLKNAQLAYDQAVAADKAESNHSPDSSAGENDQPASVDLKKLKTAAAIARTKLKKAQSQLEKLSDEDDDNDEKAALKASIIELESKVEKTQAHYLKHKTAQPDTASESDNEQRQADYDKALKLYNKAMAALDKAREQNSPAVEKMEASITKLKLKLDNAQAALQTQDKDS